jgi:hypothetical protein
MVTRYLINAAIMFTFTGLILLSACKDTGPGLTDVIPTSNVSYSLHIQPIFDYYCATSGCHDNSTQAGNLRLTSWDGTTASYSVVAPGNPTISKLYQVVSGISATPMPPVGIKIPLNANQVNGIKTWIKEGAKNN